MHLQIGLNIRALSACLSTLDKVHFGLVFGDCLSELYRHGWCIVCHQVVNITHLGAPAVLVRHVCQ